MGKQLQEWLEEFVQNGAKTSRITNWPDEAQGNGGGVEKVISVNSIEDIDASFIQENKKDLLSTSKILVGNNLIYHKYVNKKIYGFKLSAKLPAQFIDINESVLKFININTNGDINWIEIDTNEDDCKNGYLKHIEYYSGDGIQIKNGKISIDDSVAKKKDLIGIDYNTLSNIPSMLVDSNEDGHVTVYNENPFYDYTIGNYSQPLNNNFGNSTWKINSLGSEFSHKWTTTNPITHWENQAALSVPLGYFNMSKLSRGTYGSKQVKSSFELKIDEEYQPVTATIKNYVGDFELIVHPTSTNFGQPYKKVTYRFYTPGITSSDDTFQMWDLLTTLRKMRPENALENGTYQLELVVNGGIYTYQWVLKS